MRKKTIIFSAVLALFACPVIAQQYNDPSVEMGQSGVVKQPKKAIGPVRALNLNSKVELFKVQLPTGLVTVVRSGHHILGAQFDATSGTKKAYNGPFRTANQNLVVTLVPGSGGDTGFSLYEVTGASSGARLFFILVNNVTPEVQIIP